MRDYTKQPVHMVQDVDTREILTVIDYYLQDLSKGQARIQKGEVPDGSGNPIADQTLSDIYFVLLGRPGDQVGHGGTRSSGTLTFSSTTHATKGYIYLGKAASANSGVSAVAYDETNNRLGIATAVPGARLDIAIPSLGQNADPSSDVGSPNIDWGKVGGPTTFWQCLNDSDDTTYARFDGTLGPVTQNGIRISRTAAGIVDPGIDTGFQIKITMRCSSSQTNCRMVFGMNNSDSTVVFAGNTSFGSYGGPSHGGSPAASEGNITNSFVTYTLTLTDAFCQNVKFTTDWDIFFQYSGNQTNTFWDISKIQLVIPGVGGAGSEILQTWRTYGGTTNRLDYALNLAGTSVLRLSGSPALNVASSMGLEIASGSPASGMVAVAQNTDGRVRWASASSIATKIVHRWEANGPYRVDNDVDGGFVIPRACTAISFTLYRRQGGSSGGTGVKLLNANSSVLSVDPGIAFNAGNSATAAGTFSTTTFAASSVFTVSASAVDGGRPRDWAAVLEVYA